jgi:DNA replication and repair protein RecF
LPTLKKISFFQYKNYNQQTFAFSKQIICIYGANGVGKTNILDAIYYLGFTKSYFAKKDSALVQHQKSGMFVQGDFVMDNNTEKQIKVIIRENGKKELTENGEDIKYLQQHIGKIPCIMISPDDTILITEGSEYRRKFIDSILCQTDTEYFTHLINYNKILAQRNALLKTWQESGGAQWDVLDYYNQQMQTATIYIAKARIEMLHSFVPMVQKLYAEIGKEQNNIEIIFESKLINNNLLDLFKQSVQKDIILKRTTCGIHRDDIILLNGQEMVKEFASQGQKKTLLFALKIAQYQYLKQHLQVQPILLLDDVFEKLDANRSQHLLQLITQENCQTFITDTHLDRLQAAFAGWEEQVEFMEIGGYSEFVG